jgi:hypothetical protein
MAALHLRRWETRTLRLMEECRAELTAHTRDNDRDGSPLSDAAAGLQASLLDPPPGRRHLEAVLE